MDCDIFRSLDNRNRYDILRGRAVLAAITIHNPFWSRMTATVQVAGKKWTLSSKGWLTRRVVLTDEQGASETAGNAYVGLGFSLPLSGQRYRFRSAGWRGGLRVLDEGGNTRIEVKSMSAWGRAKPAGRVWFDRADATATDLLLALIAYYRLKLGERDATAVTSSSTASATTIGS